MSAPRPAARIPAAYAALCLFLIVFANAGNGGEDAPAAAARRVYAEPEDVMAAFAGFIGEGDFGAAVELFDAREQAKRFDFSAAAKRIKAMIPTSMQPAEYPGFITLNIIREQNKAALQISGFVYSFLLPDEFSDYMKLRPQNLQDDLEMPDRFVEAANPAALKGLRLVTLVYVNPEMQDSEKYRDIVRRGSAIYGYDDKREYVAIYELNGERYVGGASVHKYGDNWYIGTLQSPLAGTDHTGRVAKADRAFLLP